MVAMAAAALAVLLVCGLGIGLLIAGWQVREEIDKIRAAGEPLTAADLEAFYTLPPGSGDATVLWMEAADAVTQPGYTADAARLPLVGNGDIKLPEPDDPWPQQPAAEAFLAKYADLLGKLHEAAATGGGARYPTRFSDGITMTLKPQPELRFVALLLALECEVQARRGDAHAAVGSIRALFALARSFEHEPLLVTELLRLGKDGAAIDGLARLMQTAELSEVDLVAMDRDLATIDYYTHLYRSLLGDRVCGIQVFGNPEALGKDSPPAAAFGIFRQNDLAVYLQIMGELVAASNAKNQVALRTAMDAAKQNVDRVMNAPMSSLRYPMSKLVVPSLQACTDAVGRGTARRDVARTAIALERFRQAKGQLPDSLGDLVPDFLPQAPTDPFDGAPLRWMASDDEYRVYSIGPDGVDHGGTVAESPAAGDIVFRVPLGRTVREKAPDD